MKILRTLPIIISSIFSVVCSYGQQKAVFIIVDGIPADVIEKLKPPVLTEIGSQGGYTRAYVGGVKGSYSESPTISAVGYNHVLTGTWTNKHNVWDNDIAAPNYNYWNLFRIVKNYKPALSTAIFSTWLDNRTKLAGDKLPEAGSIEISYSFDGFELDTIRFPHRKDSQHIADIDELVSQEAGRYIAEKGPDLSWVYLEFTDDMGHGFGDSPKFYDAIRKADEQIGYIWKAIKEREKKFKEKWMIVITTDHGRNAETGKGHGGQTDRERTTWMVTNVNVNSHFNQNPAAVDIAPSLLRHLNIPIPDRVAEEMDGVPFVGKISMANLRAVRQGTTIELTWDKALPDGDAEIMLATTNNFKSGQIDNYISMGKAKVSVGKYKIDVKDHPSDFYKIVVKAPYNWSNVWISPVAVKTY